MTSKNSLKIALRAGLWGLGVAAFCVSSFLGIAGALAFVQGNSFLESENVFYSLVCAIIAWLFVAVFLFGRETIQLPQNQPASFLSNACRVLQEMGYEVVSHSEDAISTRRAFQFMVFGRGIRIKCVDRHVRISGPKLWVENLRRRLRVQNFLSAGDLSILEGPNRDAGTLLKRVQIQMRVAPKNLEGVSRHVLQLLAQEAEVICEVNVLAQSDTGIRESTVEQDIRAWLNEQGITAEIHKDLVKMAESSATIMSKSGRFKVPVA